MYLQSISTFDDIPSQPFTHRRKVMTHKTVLFQWQIFALKKIPDAPSARSKEAVNEGTLDVARECNVEN